MHTQPNGPVTNLPKQYTSAETQQHCMRNTHKEQPVEKEHGVDSRSLTLPLEKSGHMVPPHLLDVIIGDIDELCAHHCRPSSRWLERHLWDHRHSGDNTHTHHRHTTYVETHPLTHPNPHTTDTHTHTVHTQM